MLRALLLTVLLVSAAVVGCDTTATQPSSEVVVEAYLQADATLPTVRLTRTVSADEAYDISQAAVRFADVAVQQLDGDGSVTATVPYEESSREPGLYVPGRQLTVQPQTAYRLRATVPDGETVTATTTVPAQLEVISTEHDTTTYPTPPESESDQFTLTLAPGAPPPERQNVYVLTARSLLNFQDTPEEVLREELTPFYADNYDPASDTIASYRVNSSGLLNEGNFEHNGDGTITMRLPWLAVAFYGPNQIDANVVDDNLYDLLRTQQAQQTGLAPGEIPNVVEHVEGGTGVFGSYARVSEQVLIRRSDPGSPQ